jgi:proliferating cell nuclear antigen
MFKARLKEGHILRKILEAFDEVVQEVNIHVSPRGLEIKETDSSLNAYLWLLLESHGFEEFTCTSERKLGINIKHMLTIMRMTHADA